MRLQRFIVWLNTGDNALLVTTIACALLSVGAVLYVTSRLSGVRG